jgi:hypothetical protein
VPEAVRASKEYPMLEAVELEYCFLRHHGVELNPPTTTATGRSHTCAGVGWLIWC